MNTQNEAACDSLDDPTIYIVDDDKAFLAGMGRLLRATGLRSKAFDSAADFFEGRDLESAGCVIADLQMPGMNGLELQEHLACSGNPLPIIFLTGQGDVQSSVLAMRHGAEDFLEKMAPKDVLLDAVERALDRDSRERERRFAQRALKARFSLLTPREEAVLALVLKGKLNKEIASELGIDVRSVKRHRTSFMRKLEVGSVTELTQLAMGWQVLDLSL